MGRRLTCGLVAAFAAFMLLLVPALAMAQPVVYVESVNYSRGSIALGVMGDPGASSLTLARADSTLATIQPSAEATTMTFPSIRLTTKTTFTVRGFAEDGGVAWESSLTVNPADYRPERPTVHVHANKVVGSHWSFSGDAGAPITQVKMRCAQTERTKLYRVSSASNGSFSAHDVDVPGGGASFTMYAVNGFGSSPSRSIRVYNLGSDLPHKSRYILVVKSSFWMYDVSKGIVIRRWPVAIGMPWTPTPTGIFRIGSAQRSGGPWGPLRRPLIRNGHGTGYYIHGHASGACWSIGTAASHGCVRMHNTSIRQFTRVVPTGTTVKIR